MPEPPRWGQVHADIRSRNHTRNSVRIPAFGNNSHYHASCFIHTLQRRGKHSLFWLILHRVMQSCNSIKPSRRFGNYINQGRNVQKVCRSQLKMEFPHIISLHIGLFFNNTQVVLLSNLFTCLSHIPIHWLLPTTDHIYINKTFYAVFHSTGNFQSQLRLKCRWCDENHPPHRTQPSASKQLNLNNPNRV